MIEWWFLRKTQKIGEIDKQAFMKRSAYIAGLMDGEGSFSIIYVPKRIYFRSLLALAMNHEETIKFVAKICSVDYKVITRKKKSPVDEVAEETAKKTYVMRVMVEDDVERILNMLLPSLITKKRQAKMILDFISINQRISGTNKETRKDLLRKQAEIFLEVRRLNPKGGPFDENIWRKQFDEAIHRI